MMKKDSAVVFDVEHFATREGPGIRTAVFLKGCPLRCMWCHNPESWSREIERYPDGAVVGRVMSVGAVLEEVLRDKPFYDNSGGGLTVSGGEPLFHGEFLKELLARTKEVGVRTAVETSGHAPSALIEELHPLVDLWLYDIKGMDPGRHKEHTGTDNVAILRNLRWLDAHDAKIVLRCPMIPGINDFRSNLAALGALADGLESVGEVDVEPYVPYGIEKAHKLGLKVYEAPRPPVEYGAELVRRLAALTRKKVRLA